MQDRCAAENDRRAFRARPEQHRQRAEIHVVGDDDVGREIPQDLLQAFVLARDGVGKEAVSPRAVLFRPGRKIPQFGNQREDVARIQIRARGKRMEFQSGAFDAVAQPGPREADDLVTRGDQDFADGQERIQMTGSGSRGNKDFHVILSP